MKLHPLNGYILIDVIQEENITKSGIWLSGEIHDRPKEAIVMATSKDITSVRKGDRVFFAKYGITKKVLDGIEFSFIKEESILALNNKGFSPFGDNILVDQVVENVISKGGIILDRKSSGSLHAWSRVIARGHKVNEISIGHQIYFPKLLAWELDGGRLLVKLETVLCVDNVEK